MSNAGLSRNRPRQVSTGPSSDHDAVSSLRSPPANLRPWLRDSTAYAREADRLKPRLRLLTDILLYEIVGKFTKQTVSEALNKEWVQKRTADIAWAPTAAGLGALKKKMALLHSEQLDDDGEWDGDWEDALHGDMLVECALDATPGQLVLFTSPDGGSSSGRPTRATIASIEGVDVTDEGAPTEWYTLKMPDGSERRASRASITPCPPGSLTATPTPSPAARRSSFNRGPNALCGSREGSFVQKYGASSREGSFQHQRRPPTVGSISEDSTAHSSVLSLAGAFTGAEPGLPPALSSARSGGGPAFAFSTSATHESPVTGQSAAGVFNGTQRMPSGGYRRAGGGALGRLSRNNSSSSLASPAPVRRLSGTERHQPFGISPRAGTISPDVSTDDDEYDDVKSYRSLKSVTADSLTVRSDRSPVGSFPRHPVAGGAASQRLEQRRGDRATPGKQPPPPVMTAGSSEGGGSGSTPCSTPGRADRKERLEELRELLAMGLISDEAMREKQRQVLEEI